MRLRAIFFSTVFLFAGSLFAREFTEFEKSKIKEGAEKEAERERYIEEINRREPGLNYKAVEAETRAAKYRLKLREIRQRVKSGESPYDDRVEAGGLSGRWIEKGSSNLAGRIHTADVDFDRGLIYAASAGGGVWRGTLNGENWTCLNDLNKISNIVTIRIINLPSGAKRILVLGGSPNGARYSDDEGVTWNLAEGLDNVRNWGGMRRAVFNSIKASKIWVLTQEWNYEDWGQKTCLYESNDYGVSFDSLYSLQINVSVCDIWSPETGDEFYLMHRDTVSIIGEEGVENLAILSEQVELGAVGNVRLAGSFSLGEEIVYAYVRDNTARKNKVFASDDAGASWTETSELELGLFGTNSFRASKIDPFKLYIGSVELFYSEIGGIDWTKVNNWGAYYGDMLGKLHADIPGIDVFPVGEYAEDYPELEGVDELTLISTDGGLYRSFDGGQTVENISLSGLNVSQYYSTYTHSNGKAVFAGSQDQGFQRCIEDSGTTLTFEQTISGDYGHLTSSDGGGKLWTVYPGFAMFYRNLHEESPSASFSEDFPKGGRLWLPPTVAHPGNPDKAIIGLPGPNDGSFLYAYDYNGSEITSTMLPFDFDVDTTGAKVAAINYSPIDPDFWYVITDKGRFFKTSRLAGDWEYDPELETLTGNYLSGSKVLPSRLDIDKIVVAGSGHSNPGVLISLDGGNTFDTLGVGLPSTRVNDIVSTPDERFYFAATNVGPYVWSHWDSSWHDLSGLAAPEQTYWSVEYLDAQKIARFGTYGRGIWDFKIDEFLSVSKDVTDVEEIELKVSPNPARETTEITFELDEPRSGVLRIYDIEGRIAMDFGNLEFPAGESRFVWNIDKNRTPTGFYTIVLGVGERARHAKVLVE